MPKGDNAGRPPEFERNAKEIFEKTKEYINGGYKKDEAVPTTAGLATYLGHHDQWLYEWEEKEPLFGEFVKIVRTLQHKKLLTGSLLNRLNSKIAALMLSKHGYTIGINVKHELEFVYPEDSDDNFVPLA